LESEELRGLLVAALREEAGEIDRGDPAARAVDTLEGLIITSAFDEDFVGPALERFRELKAADSGRPDQDLATRVIAEACIEFRRAIKDLVAGERSRSG
jgi:hypothetical protein